MSVAHAGPLLQRESTWDRLAAETFDICVVGGGERSRGATPPA